MPYLTERALAGLKAYTYKPTGYTALDKLHEPFFKWSVQQMPLWLAPNLITLLGTIGLVGAYLLNMYYAPDYVGGVPWWVPAVSAASVVLYTWLDALDGKQARRTGASSPLGQLFDHGCDALSVNLLLSMVGSSLGVGCGWAHALGNLGVMFTWILAHWEEYHTGVMNYGNAFFGVLEANYTLAAVHVVTLVLGAAWWQMPVNQLLPPALRMSFIDQWAMSEATIVLMITIGSYQGLCNIRRVATFDPADMPHKERGHKALDATSAALHCLLLTVQLALSTLLLWPSTCTTLLCCRGSNILVGVTYALNASTLIMAHMCKEPFTVPAWTIAMLAVAALNAHLQLVDHALLVWALVTCAVGAYLHWVVVVIRQICNYLEINCLTIKAKPVSD